jgi:hypothetical protein
MSIIGIVVVLLVIGVALYFLGMIPMDATILQIIRAVVILFVVIWILSMLFPGMLGGISTPLARPVVVHTR